VLRKEVQPVSLPAFADFSLRWQGLHPEHRLRGDDALWNAIARLRGMVLPAEVWERDVLALRLGDAAETRLDGLLADGRLIWLGQGADAQHLNVRLIERGTAGVYEQAAEAEPEITADAQRVLAFLRAEGDSYPRDLTAALGLGRAQVEQALVELTLAGLVASDRYEDARAIVASAGQFATRETGLQSALASDLAAWRAERPRPEPRAPARQGWLAEYQRQAAGDAGEAREQPQGVLAGRWGRVDRYSISGPQRTPGEVAEHQARQLLWRYGVLTYDLLTHEQGLLPWSELYRQLQTMEMRGQVRRGYFVAGLRGIQYALPEAVRALREWTQPGAPGGGELVLANAMDPAYLYAALEADQANVLRCARLPSNYVALQDGVPVLIYEHGGRRWRSLPQCAPATLARAVALCREHLTAAGGLCTRPRRVFVELWDDAPPVGAAAEALLSELGFRREGDAMLWDGLGAKR